MFDYFLIGFVRNCNQFHESITFIDNSSSDQKGRRTRRQPLNPERNTLKQQMKNITLPLLMVLLLVDTADAAWLLWKHNFVTRRVEGAPRGLSPEGDVNKWELLNAVDNRKECLAALRVEHKKAYDGLVSIYPNEPVSQSTLADGISASVSTGAEKGGGPSAKTTQLYYEYTFWCLPAGVDPKTTRPVNEKK